MRAIARKIRCSDLLPGPVHFEKHVVPFVPLVDGVSERATADVVHTDNRAAFFLNHLADSLVKLFDPLDHLLVAGELRRHANHARGAMEGRHDGFGAHARDVGDAKADLARRKAAADARERRAHVAAAFDAGRGVAQDAARLVARGEERASAGGVHAAPRPR